MKVFIIERYDGDAWDPWEVCDSREVAEFLKQQDMKTNDADESDYIICSYTVRTKVGLLLGVDDADIQPA